MSLNPSKDISLSEEQLREFYCKYMSYFNTLSKYWQSVFIERCKRFISDKIIIGAEGFEPDNRVKAIIAASAMQLTLGLETWSLDYFDTIIIHPSDFENKPSGLRFKGETNLAGYVRLSWKSFIAGYQVKDKVNLGLHEFTHALRFNPVTGFEQDYFFEHYFTSWLASAYEAYNDIRQKRKTVFREYGGTNINEFLSVCIEHFFEAPEEIQKQYPMLYYSTAILLNQRTEEGKTEVNVRESLFAEKNKLLSLDNTQQITTAWHKTVSFRVMAVTSVPFVYTLFTAGFYSGPGIFLAVLILAFYLRLDYNFIKFQLEGNRAFLVKGLFIFRFRKKSELLLSQLISLRFYGNGSGEAECDLTWYNTTDNYFYLENIPTGKNFDEPFLNEMIHNKVAVFRN